MITTLASYFFFASKEKKVTYGTFKALGWPPTTSFMTASINDAMTSASWPASFATETEPVFLRSPMGRAVLWVALPRRTSGKLKNEDRSKSKMLGLAWPCSNKAKKVRKIVRDTLKREKDRVRSGSIYWEKLVIKSQKVMWN